MEIDFSSELECIVHLEIAENPKETECCHKLICENCFKALQRRNEKCPKCHEELKGKPPGKIIQRMINKMPKTCKICKFATTVGDFQKHLLKCPTKTIDCPFPNCEFMLAKEEEMDHLVKMH